MKRSLFLSIVLLLSSLTGCGGGGGGGTSTVAVSGVASKGPFISGTVNAYDISAGTEDPHRIRIGSGQIYNDNNGNYNYSFRVTPTNHPVLLEILPGSNVKYQDEANPGVGNERTLAVTSLRAMVPSLSSTRSVAITAFTELAARKAGTNPTSNDIQNANAVVAQLYRLPDITSTQPVNAAATITSNNADAINYGLALAAVSQMMKNNSADTALDTTLATLAVQSNNTISGGAAFQAAVTSYLQTNPPVKQIVPDLASSPFANVGAVPVTAEVEVGLKPDFTTKKIYYIGFRLKLNPSGSVSDPTFSFLNGAAGGKARLQTSTFAGTTDLFTFVMDRADPQAGFTISPSVPFVRLTFPVLSGVPEFLPTLEGYPGVNIPQDPIAFIGAGGNAESPASPVTASDFTGTITYKDAGGNTLQTVSF